MSSATIEAPLLDPTSPSSPLAERAADKKDNAKGKLNLDCWKLMGDCGSLNVRLFFVWSVVVRFKATGNAPMMKQNKFKISANQKFQTVVDFLRKQLHYKPTDPLVK
jgi:hypothetical protein